MSEINHPIALRPDVEFPPVCRSMFDDPGDEKSWHVSQRSESLARYYAGREPSWYASAVAPLRGADRVLDLGCGPGLGLEALRQQGSSHVLGIDRWPSFVTGSSSRAPILAHDLTLPMPFLKSGSFDGILSHYALDYISPIGMRQVLREAHRLLTGGGKLLIYLAAVGMGSGDETRTVAYSPPVMQELLAEAGFGDIGVEASPNGRNTIAIARSQVDAAPLAGEGQGPVRAPVNGSTQLSACFVGGQGRVECEVIGRGGNASLGFDLPPTSEAGSPVSVCMRTQASGSAGVELQVWAWRGLAPFVCECAQFELAATEMRVSCEGRLDHASVWSPRMLSVEPHGDAYARFDGLSPNDDLTEAQRGAEGRRIFVEPPEGGPADAADRLGSGRSRFLVKRVFDPDISVVDQEWLAGLFHGLVFAAEQLEDNSRRDLLLWAGWRQLPVFVEGSGWDQIHAAVLARAATMTGPVVLVDPALALGEPSTPLPPETIEMVLATRGIYVALGGESRALSAGCDLKRMSGRLLHGGPPSPDEAAMSAADDALRYLTERTILMRLRQLHGRSPAEVGRRSVPS